MIFLKVKAEDLPSYCNDHSSVYTLADKTIVLKHMDEVKKLLETWDVVMLAGGMKIDGAGYGNKIMAQDGSSLGHALIVKVLAAADPYNAYCCCCWFPFYNHLF